jgi:hypothetical protein
MFLFQLHDLTEEETEACGGEHCSGVPDRVVVPGLIGQTRCLWGTYAGDMSG